MTKEIKFDNLFVPNFMLSKVGGIASVPILFIILMKNMWVTGEKKYYNYGSLSHLVYKELSGVKHVELCLLGSSLDTILVCFTLKHKDLQFIMDITTGLDII